MNEISTVMYTTSPRVKKSNFLTTMYSYEFSILLDQMMHENVLRIKELWHKNAKTRASFMHDEPVSLLIFVIMF